MPNYKLGKRAPVHNPKALKLARYLTPALLPHIPVHLNWGAQVPQWPMYDNDTLGDCTIAAAAHMQGLWSDRASGVEELFTNDQIVTAYSAVSGYVPGDPNTDNGADLTTVLDYWTKTGIGGQKIYASVQASVGNTLHVKASTYLFGGAYIGLALPAVLNPSTTQPGDCWSVENDWEADPNAQPGSLGGHCVNITGYNAETLSFISWGMPLYMTWNYFRIYSDEIFGILSPNWLFKDEAPEGFNLSQLQTDLELVAN